MCDTSFHCKKQQQNHNNDIFTSTHYEKTTIHACHVISGNPREEARIKYLHMAQTGIQYNSNYVLYRIQNVAVGLLYAISLNLKLIMALYMELHTLSKLYST